MASSVLWPSSLSQEDSSKLFDGLLRLTKFDPSQPRDSDGKWSSEGGSSESTPKTPAEQHAENQEVAINALLKSIYSDPEVMAAQAANTARGSHQDDAGVLNAKGEYTEETLKENDKIAETFLNPLAKVPEGQQPTAVIAIGKPGAGKSSMLAHLKGELPPTVMVNADDIMPHLPGYQPLYAPAYHERAADIAEKHLVPAAINGHYNVTFDATGKNTDKMEKLAGNMKALGYKVVMLHGHASDFTATDRAYNRFKLGGRFVPFHWIAKSYGKGIDKTYAALKGKVDSWSKYDLQGKAPHLAESSG